MSERKECTGFSSLGEDIKKARMAKGISRRALAELVNIVPRYLANIENSGSLPSLPVLYDLVSICNLPIENYFYPQLETDLNPQRERIEQKLKVCDTQYLSVLEAALDELIKLTEAKND